MGNITIGIMYGEQLLCISIHVIQSELNYNITVRTIDKMKKIQKNVSVKILVRYVMWIKT